MIVSGGVRPESREMSTEAAHQLSLRLKNLCLLGKSFVEAGFDAVVEDIIIGARVGELLGLLRGQRFAFVMLTPRLDVVIERERGRGTKQFVAWSWIDGEIRTATRRIGLWLDTSDEAAAETVDQILELWETHAIVDSS